MAAPPFPLQGAVAVVTGAASGIGRALAVDLATHGCSLALVDRDTAGLASTAAIARHRGAAGRMTVSEHTLDLADAAGIAALPETVLAAHGRVSLLINNAGVALMGEFVQITPADFDWLFDINFWGTVRTTRAFLPALLREPAAQIVNLSSLFGIVAPGGQTAYCASKFAVRGFSEALRHELETTGVGVSVAHPGGVATAIARNARVSPGIDPADAARGLARFTKALVTKPETAAARIVAGIVRREPRILIGRDARILDALQRLSPTGYWRLMRKLTPPMTRVAQPASPTMTISAHERTQEPPHG